jgi:threonine aldolase
MRFTSDNIASVCPEVMAAMAAANAPDAGYDADALSTQLDSAFSELFETEVAALWVTTGTAANSLALAALCPPHGGILCHADSHVENDEAGAPEFFTHGAKLITVTGEGAKLDPDSVAARVDRIVPDVHRVQPAALSITNATELGRVYTVEETAAIGQQARSLGLRFHLDGARFANAVASLGCHPADISWRAGVEAMSFGFIKNGGMNAEALICFRPELAAGIRVSRKRSGHLSSKGRFQAAQILALLKDGLWIANAHKANAGAQRLAGVVAERLAQPVEANELFVRLDVTEASALRAQGFQFYDWEAGVARFVVSWDQSESDIEALAQAFSGLMQARNPAR